MAKNVIMPKFGMDQETGTVVRWLKQPGDVVTKGEPLLEVETDKVNMEVEAPASGVDAQVQALIGADLDLPDGEYAVYNSTLRMIEPAFVVRSSAGVIGANWREASMTDTGIKVVERD